MRRLLQVDGGRQAGEEDSEPQPAVWQRASEIRAQIWTFYCPPNPATDALQSVQGKYDARQERKYLGLIKVLFIYFI